MLRSRILGGQLCVPSEFIVISEKDCPLSIKKRLFLISASDDFNNGVVLTRRPLKPNELFQVRLERVVTKWAGSIEMGVTTHSPLELEFPFTMTNVRSGTWMMTGNGVMHNGTTIIEQYGQNLDRLQVGDRVGVVRKDDGSLHFFVNSVDQGVAATNVPEKVCFSDFPEFHGKNLTNVPQGLWSHRSLRTSSPSEYCGHLRMQHSRHWQLHNFQHNSL